MNLISFPTGVYGVNTYILSNEESGECIIIDPGGSYDQIKRSIIRYGLIPKHILLTHGHFDHIGALNELREFYKIDVYAHAECSRAIFDPMLNLSVYEEASLGEQTKCEPVENILIDGQEIELCGIKIKAIHAPGHSKGCIVYLVQDCAFTGDVLFNMSIGRTDLLGSDNVEMSNSLIKLKKVISPDMKVYPGHGAGSYMSKELESNPFLIRL